MEVDYTTNGRFILRKAYANGLNRKDVMRICDVSMATVIRWEKEGRARKEKIDRLQPYI